MDTWIRGRLVKQLDVFSDEAQDYYKAYREQTITEVNGQKAHVKRADQTYSRSGSYYTFEFIKAD